jgi:hypothetical protein
MTEPTLADETTDRIAPHQGGKTSATGPEAGGCSDSASAAAKDSKQKAPGHNHAVSRDT